MTSRAVDAPKAGSELLELVVALSPRKRMMNPLLALEFQAISHRSTAVAAAGRSRAKRRTCRSCFAVFAPAVACPSCGARYKPRKRKDAPTPIARGETLTTVKPGAATAKNERIAGPVAGSERPNASGLAEHAGDVARSRVLGGAEQTR